jgi:hypothetical protein
MWPDRNASILASRKKRRNNPAGLTEHDDEGHEGATRPADLQVSEVAPVGLRLFAGKRAQAQIRLGFLTRPVAGDHMAEVTTIATISPLADHRMKSGRRQGWESLKGLENERQIGIDLAGSRLRAMG